MDRNSSRSRTRSPRSTLTWRFSTVCTRASVLRTTRFRPAVQLSTGGSTLDLLATATYQVGVSTTALFEGMALGCRTAVADLPGHEYLDPAIAKGHALLMRDPEELRQAPLCDDPSSYYAPSTLSRLAAEQPE